MQFIDLKTQQARISDSLRRRIDTVLSHGKYIMGPEVAELEAALTSYTGAKHCITCASGTDALLMPLLAKGVGVGDAVFTTTFTFIATAEVIALSGATPVFVDIDPRTFNIDPAKLETAITTISADLTPRAIIPVDLFGLPADYDAINRIAKKYDLFVLEDAAQGFGGAHKGKKACNLAEVAATSFFPAKPLGCYGDGGAVFTSDDILADTLRSIRIHGKGADKYDNVRVGINGRLDTIQAAVLLAKLEIFDQELTAKQQAASHYSELLTQTIATPLIPEGYSSAWAQYSVLCDNRNKIMNALKKQEIPSMIYYPKSLHLQTAFTNYGYKKGDFPVAEEVSQKIFSLPMHAYLQEENFQKIAEIIITENK